MNILITGAAGFIGHKIAQRLSARGESIVALDDLSTSTIANLQRTQRVKFIRGCVTSSMAIAQAARDVELIIHLASVVGQSRVSANPQRACDVSAISTSLLLAAAPKTPLVLFSSSAVYGLADQGECDESAIISDDMVLAYDGGHPGYAFGKWRAEQIALSVSTHRPILIIRPFNVVGPDQSSAYGMVIPRFVDNALCNLPISIYDDGEQARSFSHVDTFVECFLRLMDKWLAGKLDHSVFNIGAPNLTTINHLASIVEGIAGQQLDKRHQPFATVYPGKKDVRKRLPAAHRLATAIGPVGWPTAADIVRDVYASRTPTGRRH